MAKPEIAVTATLDETLTADLERALSAWRGRDGRGMMKKAVRRAANLVKDSQKALAPVNEGNLKKLIRAYPERSTQRMRGTTVPRGASISDFPAMTIGPTPPGRPPPLTATWFREEIPKEEQGAPRAWLAGYILNAGGKLSWKDHGKGYRHYQWLQKAFDRSEPLASRTLEGDLEAGMKRFVDQNFNTSLKQKLGIKI